MKKRWIRSALETYETKLLVEAVFLRYIVCDIGVGMIPVEGKNSLRLGRIGLEGWDSGSIC